MRGIALIVLQAIVTEASTALTRSVAGSAVRRVHDHRYDVRSRRSASDCPIIVRSVSRLRDGSILVRCDVLEKFACSWELQLGATDTVVNAVSCPASEMPTSGNMAASVGTARFTAAFESVICGRSDIHLPVWDTVIFAYARPVLPLQRHLTRRVFPASEAALPTGTAERTLRPLSIDASLLDPSREGPCGDMSHTRRSSAGVALQDDWPLRTQLETISGHFERGRR